MNKNIPSLNGKGIDFWLVKADKYGNIELNKTYGGSWHESADAIANTSDGGLALAGYTWSFEPNGYWLVKTNGNGTLQWSHSYESNYGANALIQSRDGGFSLAGSAGSQVMVVKTNENGLQQWNISLGKSLDNQPRSIAETDDGGFVVLGYAFTGLYEPVYSWLCKVNSTGSLEWFQTLDGNYLSLAKVSSGGFVLAGSSNSSNYLVKTDALGNMQWIKPLDSFNNSNSSVSPVSSVSSVTETAGGFVVAGSLNDYVNSSSTVKSTIWVTKTDLNGNAPQDFSAPPTVASTSTRPEVSWLVILPLLVSMFFVAVVLRHRKTAHQT